MGRIAIATILAALIAAPAGAGGLDEFKVKRQEVFEFTEKPTVSRDGDTATIRFASKAFCDATVAIEDTSSLVAGYPRIVRHLASGVLGPKAPAPFQKDSLRQVLVWDGKDDRGEYIDNKDVLTVRISLGLAPSFEKNLFWEPKRRHGPEPPILQATAEGVYVYEGGGGWYNVRLFGHDGRYLRTVYPFPADKIDQVKGLHRQTYAADGLMLPVKPTYHQQSFLTCGNFYGYRYPAKYAIGADIIQADTDCNMEMDGNAASVFAVSGRADTAGSARRVALAKTYLWRMASDGSSGGLNVEGPAVCLYTIGRGDDTFRRKIAIAPRSGALSPDGKTLYLTGYSIWHRTYRGAVDWSTFHCVMKIDVAGNKPAQLFAGADKIDVFSSDDKGFKIPVAVAVDNQGRVYVADHMNNRVQIFAPDGTFLKSLSVWRPAAVAIDGKSQEIYVFTARIPNIFIIREPEEITPQLTVFGPFDNPAKKRSYPLPASFGFAQDYTTAWLIKAHAFAYSGTGFPFSATVDGYTTPPTVWMAQELILPGAEMNAPPNSPRNIELFTLDADGLKPIAKFAQDVEASVKRAKPAPNGRSRLNVNPKTGKVYVMEADTSLGGCKTLLELDPEGGPIRIVPIPFDAEDLCFDTEGLAYLRTFSVVARYDPTTWREIPWDYGEERPHVCTSDQNDRKAAAVISGLILPANGCWHHGGMYISPKGHLAVACGLNVNPPLDRKTKNVTQAVGGKPYSPRMFPGRCNDGRGGAPLIHIWDSHGQLLREDAVPGLAGNTYGLGLDRDGALYFMASAARMVDGKPYLNNVLTGTLMKAVPGKPRLLSQNPKVALPLAQSDRPKRPVDLGGAVQGPTWAEGVEWMYGGVGWDGKNSYFAPACGCWNARMAFDYFARSFAPETGRYSVAVLDSSGNLILRIGRYGNCDSAGPKSLVPLGGDGVGMVHGAYLATHADRRLFVADPANDRIFSVKLEYHATEKLPLENAPDQKTR